MNLKPTVGTAALAGVWASIGFVPFDMWMQQVQFTSVLANNLAWTAFGAVFLFLPGVYLVIGRDTGPFSHLWLLDPEQRAEYRTVAKRMVVWFLSAAIAGSLVSMAITVNNHLMH